jgi:hypothetical protein
VSACGNTTGTLTPPATRLATQTPWIIYVPVTTTPEPTILPLLPTAEPKTTAVPTRAPTRPVVVKPSVVPTKPPVVVAPVAKPTEAPTCSYGNVILKDPDNNALRRTKAQGVGGDTFRFIWDPPPSLQGSTQDSQVGYKITIQAKRANFSNGATLYVSHNKFWNDKVVILDKPAVSTLTGGDNVIVTWNVTIVRTSGSFNDADLMVAPPGVVSCGPPSETRSIDLQVFE